MPSGEKGKQGKGHTADASPDVAMVSVGVLQQGLDGRECAVLTTM